MKFRDRFGLAPKAAAAEPAPPAPPALRVVTKTTTADRSYQDLKLRIHRELIDRIDLANIARTDLAAAPGTAAHHPAALSRRVFPAISFVGIRSI